MSADYVFDDLFEYSCCDFHRYWGYSGSSVLFMKNGIRVWVYEDTDPPPSVALLVLSVGPLPWQVRLHGRVHFYSTMIGFKGNLHVWCLSIVMLVCLFPVPHHFRGSQGRKKLRITDESLDLELTAQTTILCANVLAVRVELWIKYVRLACGYGLRATRIASSSW
ncbi:hypothetical protein Cgig2_021996 [Carnegiea gigantea]|uniref:Uncharacterized protein n=1 Tax=Carnegiea gigantea TaxID=171969 RepID=A0A9Q1KT22_9CARY|nr:hypothetical protein Cgig2_021996 [Carnegiea gigantea]